MSTSLEKSHSKWSNFKLTLKSLLLVISFNALWVIILYKDELSSINNFIFPLVLIIDVIILILMIISFRKFKR